MLWFVVNTDLTVTTEKLVELFATMADRHVNGAYLYNVQLDEELDLPRAKAAEIQRNYCSPSQRRDAYLDLYAIIHPCPSWRQVAEALRGVCLYHQAGVVESTYVQGTMIILMHSLFCCQLIFILRVLILCKILCLPALVSTLYQIPIYTMQVVPFSSKNLA